GIAAHVQASAAALAQHGLDVKVLVARIESDERPAGVTVFHSPELLSPAAPVSERLGESLSLNPDVIHLHELEDPEIVDALREQAPVLISVHGYSACPSGLYYFEPGHECTRSHGPGCIPNLLLRGRGHDGRILELGGAPPGGQRRHATMAGAAVHHDHAEARLGTLLAQARRVRRSSRGCKGARHADPRRPRGRG